MDKSDPPTSFGVFTPVEHTVVVYRDAAAADAGVADLATRGFGNDAITRYDAKEMLAQVASDRLTASPLAGFGYELDLVNIHESLAKRGASFVVVHAPAAEQAAQVADSARATHAIAANHFHSLAIEEVTGLQPVLLPRAVGVTAAGWLGTSHAVLLARADRCIQARPLPKAMVLGSKCQNKLTPVTVAL